VTSARIDGLGTNAKALESLHNKRSPP
jgi:hypothetical protein